MFNLIEDILKLQGIEDVNSFLNPRKEYCEKEDLFSHIDIARSTFIRSIENGVEIDIIVDPDCDGYSSSAIIYQYIKEVNPNIKVNVYIKSGKVHGLKDVINDVLRSESKLVIIPDAGTGDIEECQKLYVCGKQVIILDHHPINPTGNPAIIVNNQLSENVTDKAMTGVGVVYKFITYLDRYYKSNTIDKYLDLVAFGMIGDRASMKNLQTRYLVLEGIKQMQTKCNYNKLLSVFVESKMYSMNNKVTINGIGFYINPLVNSLIRLGTLEDKEILFEAMCNSDRIVERKVRGKGIVLMSVQEYSLKACESTNRKQKKLTEESAEALSKDIEEYNLDELPVLVCNAKDNVDGNSTGLIAGRLSDMYKKPCLLLRKKVDVCKGSGRGYDKSPIVDFNKWCKNTGLFELVEGHPNAFGCEIKLSKTDNLFELLSRTHMSSELTYHVSDVYEAKELNPEIIKRVSAYAHVWGSDITEPLFLIKDIPVNKYNLYLVGAKQTRIEFEYHGIKFMRMTRGSSLAQDYKNMIELSDNLKITVVGKFGLDYKAGKTPQVIIEDFTYEKSNEKVGFNFG